MRDAVRFARATTAAVQMGTYFGAEVSWLHGEPVGSWVAEMVDWPRDLATKQGLLVDATMARWATQFEYLLDLGDEGPTARHRTGLTPRRGRRRPGGLRRREAAP